MTGSKTIAKTSKAMMIRNEYALNPPHVKKQSQQVCMDERWSLLCRRTLPEQHNSTVPWELWAPSTRDSYTGQRQMPKWSWRSVGRRTWTCWEAESRWCPVPCRSSWGTGRLEGGVKEGGRTAEDVREETSVDGTRGKKAPLVEAQEAHGN